jgi:DNA repair protein RadD
VKELIEQDLEKLLQHWPLAPVGVYSAGIGRKELDSPITFAGIQSIYNKINEFKAPDIVIVDECHLISHKDQGMYRTFIDAMKGKNPDLRVIGLTATPYRLGHGKITDKPALFDEPLIESIDIIQLQAQGYLAKLRSKNTRKHLSVDGVGKRGGEYIESELQKAVDVHETSEAVIDEVVSIAADRKAWLFFCAGVDHARHVCEILRSRGIPAACVTGETSKTERDYYIAQFKRGHLRALTNANVLTTGFDYPDIDLIVMMRPTMSPGLYLQMAGRGLRIKSHGGDCLVLDFAGVVAMHGPITNVNPPSKAGKGGLAPSKICPDCDEILHAAVRMCPECGHEFLNSTKKTWALHDDDIMGIDPYELHITDWRWQPHIGASSGKEMLMVSYYGQLSDPVIREYILVFHGGRIGDWAMQELKGIADRAGVSLLQDTVETLCDALNRAHKPEKILYKRGGKFYRVLDRIWDEKREVV